MTGLNTEQQRAVEATEGPLLIIAGAGSGKTRVLTHRTAYLILAKGVPSHNILAVTFTNKAADEMKERLERLLGPSGSRIWVSTFHSACVRILRKHIGKLGYGNNFVIYDDDDQMKLIKKVLKDLDMGEKAIKPQTLQARIDEAKNDLVDAETFASDANDFFTERVARGYLAYEREKKKNNAVDFGDLIMLTVRLFSEHPDILQKYQDLFRYIMVDEYQDTNYAQYRLVAMLSSRYRNICCVGDDDQSIYRFRGADIRNILDFEKDYPDAAVIRLEQNYRSTGNIIKAAGEVVRNNSGRKDKTMWTANPHGEPVSHYTAADEQDEAMFVADGISRLHKSEGRSY